MKSKTAVPLAVIWLIGIVFVSAPVVVNARPGIPAPSEEEIAAARKQQAAKELLGANTVVVLVQSYPEGQAISEEWYRSVTNAIQTGANQRIKELTDRYTRERQAAQTAQAPGSTESGNKQWRTDPNWSTTLKADATWELTDKTDAVTYAFAKSIRINEISFGHAPDGQGNPLGVTGNLGKKISLDAHEFDYTVNPVAITLDGTHGSITITYLDGRGYGFVGGDLKVPVNYTVTFNINAEGQIDKASVEVTVKGRGLTAKYRILEKGTGKP
jgi:hypothetical protein